MELLKKDTALKFIDNIGTPKKEGKTSKGPIAPAVTGMVQMRLTMTPIRILEIKFFRFNKISFEWT